MKVLGLLMALVLGGVRAWAVESIWPIEGQLGLDQGNDPKKTNAENLRSLGGDLSLSVAPVFYWPGSAWRFTPSYDTNYSGVNNVLKVDENLYLFAQQWDQQLDMGGTLRPNADTRYIIADAVFTAGFGHQPC